MRRRQRPPAPSSASAAVQLGVCSVVGRGHSPALHAIDSPPLDDGAAIEWHKHAAFNPDAGSGVGAAFNVGPIQDDAGECPFNHGGVVGLVAGKE